MTLKLKLACCLLPCLLASAALVMLAGCEGSGSTNEDNSGAEQYFKTNPYTSAPRTDPGAAELTIDPPSYIVSYKQQHVIFTVAGGEGSYHWGVSMPQNGSISAGGANQAVYIVANVGVNTIQVQDDAGHYGAAYIVTSSTNIGVLAVSPTSITLSGASLYASFTVSGGTPPYTWTAGNVKLGTVSYSAGTSYLASYTAVAGAYGQNVITVTDSDGLLASAAITQTP
jgi:hypothetical protein